MRKLIVLLSFFTLAGGLFAQTYSFQHIGVEDGLSQSVITSVVQDRDGVFWIGTMSGLTRYDGNEFEVLMKEEGLAENWITSSVRDKNGNLWFGHWGGGVSFYDSETGLLRDMKFERFSNFKSISSMLVDRHGDVWFGTKGAGLFKYESSSNTIVTMSREDGFLSNNINAMSMDQVGNLWFGTNSGVVIYRSAKKLEEKGAFALLTSSDGLADDKIISLTPMGENTMVAASEFKGVSIIDNISNLANLSYRNIGPGLPSMEVSCLFQADDDNLWMGTRDKGVIRYNRKTNSAKVLSTEQGLNYFKVNTIFRDRESNIWIGTDLGLNLFRGDEFLIYDESDGLANNVVWSVIEDRQNRMWFGTNDGISIMSFRIDNTTKEVKSTEVRNITKGNGLNNSIVLSLFQNSDGNIWAGTGLAGINVLSSEGSRIRVIDSASGLASNTIYAINRDENGNIWAGTNKGVSRISPSGEIRNFTSKDGLGGDNIYKIYRDSKGKLWFASIGGFLSSYDRGEFKRHGEQEDDNESHKFITTVTEDKEGNIWFGAYGQGIFKISGNGLENYSTSDGLSSNSPYSMIADDNGNLWIGTGKGIDKFNLANKTTKTYKEKEGFLGVEPNPNAIYLDHQGNLWFGTIMGAVKFDLSEERKNIVEPLTKLEEIRVNYEPFEFPEGDEFSYDENHITFHYIGVSLTNPEHIEYKYMLEGFDEEWSPITKKQDVVYSNLAPGSYEFKVMASNNDGLWNELPSTYKFSISPPFWRTWWFYTLCVILLISGIYVGDKIRMRKLIADKQKLERTVEERTAEVVEQKKVVEEKNREILDSIKYAKRIQEAILPPAPYIEAHLKNYFILYKPKDIVAGDFYFFETKGDDVFIAAADCTGHGVPGAMVSVVCSNALNRAVHELDLSEPAQILDKVRELVVETFQKSEHEVKDGMDISFIRLNQKKRTITFTGAHNALYRVTDEEDKNCDRTLVDGDKVLCEYKGDKQPIGKFTFEAPFTQKEIKVKKGDIVYMSTDGFPDQFGGDLGKKFMYKPFKQMFLNVHEEAIDKQKKDIDTIFEEWRGSTPQIDDVCLIGIKID